MSAIDDRITACQQELEGLRTLVALLESDIEKLTSISEQALAERDEWRNKFCTLAAEIARHVEWRPGDTFRGALCRFKRFLSRSPENAHADGLQCQSPVN